MYNYLIEGVRGSGKTVLMTTVANILRSEHDWLVVNINPTLDLLDDLARRLNDVCRTIPNLLSKGFNVSIAGYVSLALPHFAEVTRVYRL